MSVKVCKAMQTIIEAIAKRHGLDLSTVGAHLRLEMPGYLPLCIEVVGERMISVAHFFLQAGDLLYDPEMVFYVQNGAWIPLSITQAPVGVYREVLFLDDDGMPERYEPRMMRELASFSTMWARNITAQGWLTVSSTPGEGR